MENIKNQEEQELAEYWENEKKKKEALVLAEERRNKIRKEKGRRPWEPWSF